MPQFQLEPVVVIAHRLTATNGPDLIQWMQESGTRAVLRGGPRGGSRDGSLIIDAGRCFASVGDWVVRMPNNRIATYEDAEFHAQFVPHLDTQYAVEIGGEKFTKEQWTAVERYIDGMKRDPGITAS